MGVLLLSIYHVPTVSSEARRGPWILLGLYIGWGAKCVLGIEPGPLEEYQVLLTTISPVSMVALPLF